MKRRRIGFIKRIALLSGVLLLALVVFAVVRYVVLRESGSVLRILWETLPAGVVLLVSFVGALTAHAVYVKKPAKSVAADVENAVKRHEDGQPSQADVGEWGEISRALESLDGAIGARIAQAEISSAERARTDAFLAAALATEEDVSPAHSGYRESHYGIAAAVHRSSSDAYADFYDYFFAQGRSIFFVIGDIWGSGFSAVRFAARVKELFRICAQNSDTLLEAVEAVNGALCAKNGDALALTAFFGMFSPATGELRYVNAGHYPPALVGAESRFMRVNAGSPLGLYRDPSLTEEYIVLQPGCTVMLYTNGVPDAANESGESFGYERLTEAVERGLNRSLGAEVVVSTVEEALAQFCQKLRDDYTVLSLYYPSGLQKKFAPKTSELERLRDLLLEWLKDDVRKNKIFLACEEVFTNIVNHSGASSIQLDCSVEGESLIVRFIDDGEPFNPLQPQSDGVRDYTDGGMGMAIIRQIAGEVHYRMQENRNVLTMRFPVLNRN